MRKWPVVCALLSCSAVGVLSFPAASQESGKSKPQADISRGKVVFENNCDECHDAYSKDERAGPGLQGMKDGKLPDGRKVTHDLLLDIINTGPAEMTSFKDRLTEQEKEDVVAFVMTL